MKATVPLVRQTWLCKKKGRYVALKMVLDRKEKRVRFEVVEATSEQGLGFDPAAGSRGGNATCSFCGTVADGDYIQAEGGAGKVSSQRLALVCRKKRGEGTIFLTVQEAPDGLLPSEEGIRKPIEVILKRSGLSLPTETINGTRPSPNARGLSAPTRHGLTKFADLFHPRQLLALLATCETVQVAVSEMRKIGFTDDHAKAVAAYLGIVVDRLADRGSAMCRWDPGYTKTQSTFGRPALPFVWDFSETNPFGDASGDMAQAVGWVCRVIEETTTVTSPAVVERGSALSLSHKDSTLDAVITDPPYYDNVPYGDLSDFFYVWLKRSIGTLYPEHFSSELTPK